MNSIGSFFTGFVAAGVGVFLVMLLLLGQTRTDLEEQGTVLADTRAQLAEAELELAGIDLLAVYCRGVIDQYLNGFATPELQERNDPVCIEIMTEDPPPGFRGP